MSTQIALFLRTVSLIEKDPFDEHNTVKFSLHVKCTRKEEYIGKTDKELRELRPEEYLNNHFVFAEDFVWEPLADQESKFGANKPCFLYGKLLVAKRGEGQEIELEVYCSKNYGEVHTKWSPVSTAFYKLAPYIELKKKIKGDEARRLNKLCPTGVFDIEDDTLIVKNSNNCTMCRACIGDEKNGDSIFLGKEKFHYYFSIESIGVLDPIDLFSRALDFIIEKSSYYKTYLEGRD